MGVYLAYLILGTFWFLIASPLVAAILDGGNCGYWEAVILGFGIHLVIILFILVILVLGWALNTVTDI